MLNYNFEGKIVLVTGGSRGIGRSIAEKFAAAEADVHVTYKNSIDSNHFDSLKIKHYRCDVSSSEEVSGLIEGITKSNGKIDIVVNNAGITKDGLLMRMSEDDWVSVIDTNLKGVFNVTKAVTRGMMGKRYGKIINITSVVGIIGNAGQSNYVASKAGVIGFTKSIAKELGSRNINVNAVAPGFIDTEMTSALNEDLKKSYMDSIPLKRFAKPDEVASLVMFLASDDSSYITGQTIAIDGGLSM